MINYSRRLIVCIIVVDNHCCPPSPDDQFWQNAEKHFHSETNLFRVMIMPRQCCIAIISHPRAILLNVQQMVQIQFINVIALNLRFFFLNYASHRWRLMCGWICGPWWALLVGLGLFLLPEIEWGPCLHCSFILTCHRHYVFKSTF